MATFESAIGDRSQRRPTQEARQDPDPSAVNAVTRRIVEFLGDGQARVARAASAGKEKTAQVVSDRRMQVTAASGLCGAAVVGAGGAGVGLLIGGTAGTVLGLLPALFTFGLSIPAGAALGAGFGVATGGAVGGTVGLTGASAIGYGAYTRRAEIQRLLQKIGKWTEQKFGKCFEKVASFGNVVRGHIIEHVASNRRFLARILTYTKHKTLEAAQATKTKTGQIASNEDVQAATASAVGGAVVLGTGGAATGLATGGAIGAAIGLVPAIFTFGLSIPFGAAIGGGCGLAAGTAVGSTTGAVAGAGGYCAYTRRAGIRCFVGGLAERARSSAKLAHARLSGANGAAAA